MRIKKVNVYNLEPDASVSNTYDTDKFQFKAPGIHMFLGARMQGKTRAMGKVLKNAQKSNVYDRIYMISNSAESNRDYFGDFVKDMDIIPATKDSIDIIISRIEEDRDEYLQYLDELERYQRLLIEIKALGIDEIIALYEEGFVDEKGKPIKPTFKYERNNKTRPPTQLLIVDDCLQSDSLLKSNGKHTISSIMLYNRHIAPLNGRTIQNRSALGLGVFFAVQSYSCSNGTPRFVREQLTELSIMGRIKQPKQYEKVREEVLNIIDPDEFDLAYEYSFKKGKFNSLTISFGAEPDMRFRHNFNNFIIFDKPNDNPETE